jgi:ribulose-phosphate 3-epimerase
MSSSNSPVVYSVSAISTSPRNFFNCIENVVSNGVGRIHVDVMDGRFVPRFGLYPEFVAEIRQLTSAPIDVHMMIEDPENYIHDFVSAGASRIVPHVEPVSHLHRLVSKILDAGAEAGLAINPHSDARSLKYLLPEISVLTVMAINPGMVGHKSIPWTLEKVKDVKQLLREREVQCLLEVDGGVNFANIPNFRSAGTDILVVGAGSLFHPSASTEKNLENLNKIRAAMQSPDSEHGLPFGS